MRSRSLTRVVVSLYFKGLMIVHKLVPVIIKRKLGSLYLSLSFLGKLYDNTALFIRHIVASTAQNVEFDVNNGASTLGNFAFGFSGLQESAQYPGAF